MIESFFLYTGTALIAYAVWRFFAGISHLPVDRENVHRNRNKTPHGYVVNLQDQAGDR